MTLRITRGVSLHSSMEVQKVNALPPYCSVVRANGRSVLAFLKHMNPSFAREACIYLDYLKPFF